jgi:hypothetical protein
MALVLADRVQETTTTTGTGSYSLAGASTGFRAFSAVLSSSDTTYYAATDGTDWEVGIGTFTSPSTLARTTILSSSNGNSEVSWSVGDKDVFITYPAGKAVYFNSAGQVDVDNLRFDGNTISSTNTDGNVVLDPNGTGSVDVSSAKIINVATPTTANDATNKAYVDSAVSAGVHFHEPVRVESPINLNATYNNGTDGVGATLTNAGTQAALVIDGITLSVSDRVLVYQQTTQTQNGVYTVTNVGSGSTNWVLTRATDADTYVFDSPDGLSEGSTFFVQEGNTGAGETYTCNTPGTITFGTTNITFVQVSSAQIYTAGAGLDLNGTQFSVETNGITNAMLRQSAGLSVIGRSENTTGDVADVTAGTDHQVLRRSGTSVGFGAVALDQSAAVSGTLPVTSGGTGQTSFTNGELLIGNTTGNTLTKATLTPGSGISITNGNGSITIAASGASGTVTSVSGTGTVQGITLSGTVTSSGNLTLGGSLSAINLASQVTGTLPVANGGTGITAFGSGVATFLNTPSSANLAAAVTNETGTGSLVFGTNPTLTGFTLGGEAACADNLVTRPTLKDYAVEGSALGSTGASPAINLNNANFFSATVSAICTFTFSNPPASGDFGAFVLELTNGGAFAITWPASVDWPGGVPPSLSAAGKDQLVFTTRDAGTTWLGFVAGYDIK